MTYIVDIADAAHAIITEAQSALDGLPPIPKGMMGAFRDPFATQRRWSRERVRIATGVLAASRGEPSDFDATVGTDFADALQLHIKAIAMLPISEIGDIIAADAHLSVYRIFQNELAARRG